MCVCVGGGGAGLSTWIDGAERSERGSRDLMLGGPEHGPQIFIWLIDVFSWNLLHFCVEFMNIEIEEFIKIFPFNILGGVAEPPGGGLL